MKQVYKIDSDGFYLEPVIIEDADTLPDNCVEEFPTKGLYKHRWNGQEWEEGLTQEEIQTITNAPQPLSELDQLKKQQTDLIFDLMMNGVL
jgi:hypothetical protein